MSFLLVIGGAGLLAFGLSFLRSGRFGATVLALGAGYLLTLLWSSKLLEFEGLLFSGIPLRAMIESAMILVPGLLALLLSQKQKSYIPKQVAAVAVAVLVSVLLMPYTALDSRFQGIYELVAQYGMEIVTGILCFGLIDMVLARPDRLAKHKEH